MNRPRFLWWIYRPYLILVLISVVAVAWLAAGFVYRFVLSRLTEDVAVRAGLVAAELPENVLSLPADSLNRLSAALDRQAAARVTIVLRNGRVLADSRADVASAENHADRPEIMAAFAGRSGSIVRHSFTMRQDMLYVAVPLRRGEAIVAALRLAVPVATIRHELRGLVVRIALGGVIVALLAGGVAWLLARRVTQPIREMAEGAAQYAAGDLSHRTYVPRTAELAMLADAMNDMAAQLDQRLRLVTQQRNEQEAVLTAMRDAVLAVDADERVRVVNRAAEEMLDVNGDHARGKLLQEVVRNSDLQRFLTGVLHGGEPAECEMVVHGPPARVLLAAGAPLRDASGARVGALAVLSDITRLRQLESHRKEFVANVSHELRTPITTIQGFLETLRDDPPENPADVRAFLERILRSTERLNTLVENLLILSRVERDAESGTIERSPSRLDEIAESAVAACAERARSASISVHTRLEAVTWPVNRTLMEHAIINLLDNAIKFSERGQRVDVELRQEGDEAVIRVVDGGCGIAGEHLPRIFERFYRVDSSRSSRLGGTGLGLAIVKHIAQAHGGHVGVASTPGRGSTFELRIPLH